MRHQKSGPTNQVSGEPLRQLRGRSMRTETLGFAGDSLLDLDLDMDLDVDVDGFEGTQAHIWFGHRMQ